EVRARHQSQHRQSARPRRSSSPATAGRRGDRMRRRELILALGGGAAWPLAARAQQPERMRRIGVIMSLAADGRETQARHAAFLQGLQQLGWTDGRNARIEFRGATDADHIRRYAAELVALAPDVILSSGTAAAGPPLPATPPRPNVFRHAPAPAPPPSFSSLPP